MSGCLLVLALVTLRVGTGMGRFIDDDPTLVILSGSLLVIEPSTKQVQYRLTRTNLNAITNVSSLAVRLEFGPQHTALDMNLTHKSVWTAGSQLVERRGNQTSILEQPVEASCFLCGRLTSRPGALSLNRCGKLTGMIDGGNFHFSIEEEGDGLTNEVAPLKVTKRKGLELNDQGDDFAVTHTSIDGNQFSDAHTRIKRQNQRPLRVEVAAYLDAGFATWQDRYRGRWSSFELQVWIVQKWDIIQEVYGNVENAGLPIILQLKRIEIWWENPDFYQPLPSDDTEDVIRMFCTGTLDSLNFDHKMLYTQGTGGSHMGMAFSNGVCVAGEQCALVKSKEDEVKIELHELGHNLGLPHDNQFDPPCTDPTGDGGFMGWGDNYDFLDCYRRTLVRTLRAPEKRCLLRRNVDLYSLNYG